MRHLLALAGFLFGMSSSMASESIHFTRSSLGLMLGAPTGLTGKFWIDPDHALDAGLAYSLDQFLLIQSHYLTHLSPIAGKLGSGQAIFNQVRPYWGMGGTINFSGFKKTENGLGLALRVPLGLEWSPNRFSFFAEMAPGLGLFPSTFGLFEGSLGARFQLP